MCVVIYHLVGAIQVCEDLKWAVAKKLELEVDQVPLRMDDTLDLSSALHNIIEKLERIYGPAFYLLVALNFPPAFLHGTPKPLPQVPRSKS